MRQKVLVSAPYMQMALHRYRSIFDQKDMELIVPPVRERLSEKELLKWIKDTDGIICGDDQFTERVLRAAAPRLKVISKWGTGTDSIDLAACKRLGIEVFSTPNAFSEPVADTVLGYMLCFARKLPEMDRMMHQGGWQKVAGRALGECSLGVIGVGNVGKTVVRRAVPFGIRILGNDIVDMPAPFLAETGIEMTSRENVLHQADYVSLNCDLNPTSFRLIGEAEFALMKNSAVIINTARGPIIDEAALIRALQENRIAGAALDVFDIEPLPKTSPLRRMENVLLAPHNANSSPEAWKRVHENTIHNLLQVLERSKP